MSHVVTLNVEIKDLAALRAAVARLGGELRVQSAYHTWITDHGRLYGDFAPQLPLGFSVADIGKCEFAICFPGVQYEIGVCARRDGMPGYCLLWDFYDGNLVKAVGGVTADALIQAYHVELQIAGAYADGATCVRETRDVNGDILLEIEA